MITKANVLPKGTQGETFPHKPITLRSLVRGTEWKYEKLERIHKLSYGPNSGDITVLRSDVESDEEEEEVEAYVPEKNWEENEITQENVEGGEIRKEDARDGSPTVIGLEPGMNTSPYYSYLCESVSQARPESFSRWPEQDRIMFDRQSQEIADNRAFKVSMMHAFEEFKNQNFRFNEQVRREVDYERGYSHCVRPRPTQWSDLPPYAETHRMPRRAQSTPSECVPPYQQHHGEGSSSSSATDPFRTQNLHRSLFESVFGQPYPQPPYDG